MAAFAYKVDSGGEGAFACGLRKYLLVIAGCRVKFVDIMLELWSVWQGLPLDSLTGDVRSECGRVNAGVVAVAAKEQ